MARLNPLKRRQGGGLGLTHISTPMHNFERTHLPYLPFFSWQLQFIFFTLTLFFSLPDSSLGQFDQQQQILRRFEYKHSFRIPNLAQRDGTIPFWTVAGDAIASGEQLRLAPSMRSRKGLAWNKRQFIASDHFELEVALKVTGQGRIGADGMALWYTSQQGTLGPVFGANDYWTGMGIMLDSFDNDGARNNPTVSLMINDGTRTFDHQTDGSSQVLSSCQKDFRNKQFPVYLKVNYLRNVLTVLVSDGMSPTPRYELCIRAENIFLPKSGFFGVSAATGGLADDHDVLDFSVFSLFTDTAQLERAKLQLAEEERTRAEAEFERQQKEFEKERQKFKEQHPDKAKDDEDQQAKYYEDGQMRELRLIYEAQSNIHKVMQQMELKLQEIAQQQRTMLVGAGGAATVQQPVGGQQQAAPGVGFLTQEKNELVQGVREISATLRDMKNYVTEIYTRSYNIEQKVQHIPASGAGTGSATPNQDPAIRNYLEQLQQEVRQIRSNQIAQAHQPATGQESCAQNCLTGTLFTIIVALQSVALIVFIFIR